MRDTLNSIEYYDKSIAFKQLCINEDKDTVGQLRLHNGRAMQLKSLCSRGTNLCIQRYSRGDALAEMTDSISQMAHMYGLRHRMMPNLELDSVTREMWETLHLTNFHEDLACLTFLVALRYTRQNLVLASQWIGHQGEDGLLDRIALILGDTERRVKRDSKFELQYQPLVEVIDASADKRSTLLNAYVETWYKRLKAAAWHNTHKGEAYNGYWCFEAALVAMLWDINDSAFQGHKHYPADLVKHFRATKPE